MTDGLPREASDEATALRTQLEEGDWRRLVDPLLTLVLLDDPGTWWRHASMECESWLLEALARALPPQACAAAVARWGKEVTPGQVPPFGWPGSLNRIREGELHAVSAAVGVLLAQNTSPLGESAAERLLVTRLLEQLGDVPLAAEVRAAVAILDQWPWK